MPTGTYDVSFFISDGMGGSLGLRQCIHVESDATGDVLQQEARSKALIHARQQYPHGRVSRVYDLDISPCEGHDDEEEGDTVLCHYCGNEIAKEDAVLVSAGIYWDECEEGEE
jgi:hypothetical protein